jgi:hypothetical protein
MGFLSLHNDRTRPVIDRGYNVRLDTEHWEHICHTYCKFMISGLMPVHALLRDYLNEIILLLEDTPTVIKSPLRRVPQFRI